MRWVDIELRSVRKRSRLLHWETLHAIQSITFNLFDAVPAELLRTLRREIETLERQRIARFGTLSPADVNTLRREMRRRLQRLLDQGHGSCFMNVSSVAELVAHALEYFDGGRYQLYAWCVMPNHVHAVMSVAPDETLDSVLHSWKSYTSKEANRILNRRGCFWQDDYFDRTVRNPEELRRWVDYVVGNPAKAGLVDWTYWRMYAERLGKIG